MRNLHSRIPSHNFRRFHILDDDAASGNKRIGANDYPLKDRASRADPGAVPNRNWLRDEVKPKSAMVVTARA